MLLGRMDDLIHFTRVLLNLNITSFFRQLKHMDANVLYATALFTLTEFRSQMCLSVVHVELDKVLSREIDSAILVLFEKVRSDFFVDRSSISESDTWPETFELSLAIHLG